MIEFEIIDNESITICPICMDKQCKSKIQLGCNHKIHAQCFKQWVEDNKQFSCPNCKKILINKDIYICSICNKEAIHSIKIGLIDNEYCCFDCLN